MALPRVDQFLYAVIGKDIDLSNNLALLRKFVASWIKSAVEDHRLIPTISNWYKNVFLQYKNLSCIENSCILAVVVLEQLLEDGYHESILSCEFLFPKIILPLQEMIACNYLNAIDNVNVNTEILLTFYRIHAKLARNVKSAELEKKYGLWKPLMHFYLANTRFSFLVQNICTEYLSSLLATECIPDELFLFLEIITSNARLIKMKTDAGCINSRSILHSFRLLYLVLFRNISKLNQEAFSLISRKCHSLTDSSLKIALDSKNILITKNAFRVYILLKYCSVAGDDNLDSSFLFERFIYSIVEALFNQKFLKFICDACELFGDIFPNSVVRNLCFHFQIIPCEIHLQRLLHANDLPFHKLHDSSNKFLDLVQQYDARLQGTATLPLLVDSILKSICSSPLLNEENGNYLLRFLASVLKNFVKHDGILSSDTCNLLINITHAVRTLLINFETNIFDDILGVSFGISQLETENRIDVKVAALNLCKILLRKSPKVFATNVEIWKRLFSDGLKDTRWEVRDCVLEIITEMFMLIADVESENMIADRKFFEPILNALQDEESYVRASAYEALSSLTSSLDHHSCIDVEKLLLQTIAAFNTETEYNVRVRMIIFIQHVWEKREIMNSSLAVTVYKTIYHASSVDLNEEVRTCGMRFWQQLVESFVEGSDKSVCSGTVIFDQLSIIGCLQAVMDAIEDDYDSQVRKIALNILDALLSINLHSENFNLPENNNANDSVFTIPFKNIKKTNNERVMERATNEKLLTDHVGPYISGREFLCKYGEAKQEKMIVENLDETESLDVKDLLNYFKKVSFYTDINEKDCY